MRLRDFGRPWVVFNPANTDHRQWFQDFLSKKSWGSCPVRFVIDDKDQLYGNLIDHIQTQLVQYYLSKEFGEIKVDKAA